ncbi:retrotransposon protein, putative, ty1-copia subclass [Tanacetum coccineum]|uniref:Retrotransposon protein, putative, ty1-copia subclass n=1 Tax=Tanacetum coccineum TaxID=301880 RepID=A0ABQ5FBL3_9ASTR
MLANRMRENQLAHMSLDEELCGTRIQLVKLHAMLIEYEKGLPKKAETPQPLPAAPADNSEANVMLEWNAIYDAYNEVACLILGSMTPELHRQFENSLPYDMIKELKAMFEKQAGVERFDLIQTFYAFNKRRVNQLLLGIILNGLTKDFAGFVRNYNMHNMGKTIGELHAMLIEYEKGFPKKAKTLQVMMIKSGKIQKANKKSLKAKGKGKANDKRNDKQVYIPKPKNPKPSAKEHPAKDDAYHHCKERFREARKLKQGALYLYVGNGVRAQVKAIGSYELVVPNGLVICLDNCHYAPFILRGVVSVHRLVENRFDQRFTDFGISVSKNNVHYFNAIPSNGKMTRKSFPHHPERATDLLGIIHTHVCGPLRHVSKQVENQIGKTIKALRSDRGGEYISQEFKDYLKACGIVQQLTPPYTPQHNGVSERRNHTLLDMVRSMMNLTTLPLSFWDYALESATRILNMVPTKKVDKTPYELWYGKVPNLSYLKVWGCEALVKRDTPDKLQQRSVKCIFIGYPKETMGYYFYFPPENKIVVVRYAEFFEKNHITQEVSERAIDLEEIQDEDTSPSEITSEIPMEVEGFEPPQEEDIPIRRSKRTRRAPNRLSLNVEAEKHSLGDLNEPTSYKAVMLDSESNKWTDAMNAEIQSMMDNMVWVLVDLPPGCKTVGSKWIFKKKTDINGIVHVYKARLVAKGYTQLYGVYYEETLSPVTDIRAIRILIFIAAYYDYEIWQMNVKTAFLNGYLDEDIYMVQPEDFVDPNHPRKVCKLQRSIYSLKQASRSWNKRFDEEIKRFRFSQNLDEPCVYQKASESNVTFLILYVDDIIIMRNYIPSLQSVKDYLGKRFAMKDLGEATFILGIKIYRDRSKRLIRLGQNAYMDKILKRYKMDNSKRGHIPMQERLDLNKSQGAQTPKEVNRMKNVPYASAVGSIMYAVRCTRPDVAFAQNMTSRFQQNPGEPHWTAVKNILKYLRNTKDMFLVYGGNPSTELRVECYCDAGFETDRDDTKSQTGYVFVLNGGAVDWKSSKQSTTAMSATESEYIAASEAAMEAVWIRKFISGLGIVPTINEPLNMYCDNSAAVHYANEPGVQKGARHYQRRYHYVRECVELGEIRILKVHTDNNLADPFTKALSNRKLTQHARGMGLRPASSFM